MNGRVLATQVCALRPETRVLFMSGYIDSAVVERGIRTGVADERLSFIRKPFTPDLLATKVRDVLSQAPPAVA